MAENHAHAMRRGCQPQGQLLAGPVPTPAPAPWTQKTIRALVASILTPAYHRLRATLYQDLGPNHFRRASPQTQAIRLARRIANVGFTGTLSSAAANTISV
jgi:hypothetical protein